MACNFLATARASLESIIQFKTDNNTDPERITDDVYTWLYLCSNNNIARAEEALSSISGEYRPHFVDMLNLLSNYQTSSDLIFLERASETLYELNIEIKEQISKQLSSIPQQSSYSLALLFYTPEERSASQNAAGSMHILEEEDEDLQLISRRFNTFY